MLLIILFQYFILDLYYLERIFLLRVSYCFPCVSSCISSLYFYRLDFIVFLLSFTESPYVYVQMLLWVLDLMNSHWHSHVTFPMTMCASRPVGTQLSMIIVSIAHLYTHVLLAFTFIWWIVKGNVHLNCWWEFTLHTLYTYDSYVHAHVANSGSPLVASVVFLISF